MSKSDTTKRRIAAAFIELAESMPIDKVSIALLVEHLGMNRKTFYYHFKDKTDLIRWIFRSTLAEELAQRFEPGELSIPEPGTDKSYPHLPHYARVTTGPHSLDQSKFYLTVYELLSQHRTYYLEVFEAHGRTFYAYLHELYEPSLESDILFMLGNRTMPQASVRFLATYYSGAVLSMFFNTLKTPDLLEPRETLDSFFDLTHESLRHTIDNHAALATAGAREA